MQVINAVIVNGPGTAQQATANVNFVKNVNGLTRLNKYNEAIRLKHSFHSDLGVLKELRGLLYLILPCREYLVVTWILIPRADI